MPEKRLERTRRAYLTNPEDKPKLSESQKEEVKDGKSK